MESFVQAWGGVELNVGSFLHLEFFFKKFPGCWSLECHNVGLNVATLKTYLLSTLRRWFLTSDVENILLCNVVVKLDSNVATLE